MTGPEELVNRLNGTDEARPLRRRGEGMGKIGADGLTCPICSESKLGIDCAPHHLSEREWIVKAWCRRCGLSSDLDTIAAAVGITPTEVRAGVDSLPAKYPIRPPEPPPTPGEVTAWHRVLMRHRDLLGYLIRERGISEGALRRFVIGHDGARFTLPVFDWRGRFQNGSLPIVNLRRYDPDGEPKMLSLAGSGAQIYTPVRSEPLALICEGEWDALRAWSVGVPAITNTGGASTWKDEWTERIGRRHVCVAYDRDHGGELGEARVRESFERVGHHLSLTIVRLPMPYKDTRGYDLSDYLADHTGADLMDLLRRSWKARHARSPGRYARLLCSAARWL